MKTIVCEMCGSSDLIKQDGVFICQACGMKYSVEEAKKMMIEGTVEVQGTVKIDNMAQIENYLEIAKNAYKSGNIREAESYCNRIIEIEPKNYEAWLIKGETAGWQSSLAHPRVEESIQCFSKAIDFAPEDKYEEIAKLSADEILKMSTALVGQACKDFKKYLRTSEADAIGDALKKANGYACHFVETCNCMFEDPAKLNGDLALLITSYVCEAWTDIKKRYYNDNEGHPSKNQWEKFKAACWDCIGLLELVTSVPMENEKDNILRYMTLIEISKELMESCSWKKEYLNGKSYWVKEWCLTDDAKETHSKNILEYHQKIKELEPDYVIPNLEKAATNDLAISSEPNNSIESNESQKAEKKASDTIKGLSILSLILSFVAPLIGLILGIWIYKSNPDDKTNRKISTASILISLLSIFVMTIILSSLF